MRYLKVMTSCFCVLGVLILPFSMILLLDINSVVFSDLVFITINLYSYFALLIWTFLLLSH